MSVVGKELAEGVLPSEEVRAVAGQGLEELPVDGRRVLVLIPDGTRSMPMPLLFEVLDRRLGPRAEVLDFLVALGTHAPLSDERLGSLVGRAVVDGRAGDRRVMNHCWDDPSTFVTLGTLRAEEIESLSGGRLRQSVPVALNRLVLDYDHLLICGPVFPHEVVGFSGGTKYLFPGIAGPDIINFTHWLGALITNAEVIGTRDTPIRAVIDRAARFVDRPMSLLAPVVTHDGVAGIYCGTVRETWEAAASLSARRHIVWLERPLRRVLSVMPTLYDDLWTAAKGMYKVEPAVADGGEVVIFAPHVGEVSFTHGRLIDEIGYHCRDYFLEQWDRFGHHPGSILAHSTHVKGAGTYDAATGAERPRISVTLATGIPRERCERLNLGYADPRDIDPDTWADGEPDALVIPRAGEHLYRLGPSPDAAAGQSKEKHP